MKTKLVLVFSAVATACLADVGDVVNSFTTLSGRTYRAVTIAQVQPDGVTFRHSRGAGKVLFSDLPADLRRQLGYDAKKADAYEKDLMARRERERLACIERDKELAKARASASAAAAAQARACEARYAAVAMLGGGVTDSGGMLTGYTYPWALDWYGWLGNHPRRALGFDRRTPAASGGHPFSAGQIVNGPAYSGATHGARFTNGVPALGSSFSAAPVRTAPVVGTAIIAAPARH
ncbi:MAG: hypothetical protein K1X78_08735 [Verrucomicrobiaceae bacterium]|nr:hypothetical protein [Verrucomicrobiaceae bacterium]